MRLNASRLVTTFFTLLKAGPAGGRLRRPSSAGNDTTGTGEPPSPFIQTRAAAAPGKPRPSRRREGPRNDEPGTAAPMPVGGD
jgi:hypothetical protein